MTDRTREFSTKTPNHRKRENGAGASAILPFSALCAATPVIESDGQIINQIIKSKSAESEGMHFL